MATRLTFLCAGATASSRVGAFPRPDEPLDDAGRRKAAAFRLPRGSFDVAMSSPGASAIETAEILGLSAAIEPTLADLDFGDWAGRTLIEVERDDPEALTACFEDPTRAAPAGESMAALAGRIGGWIDRQADANRRLLVVGHPAVMRAAVAHALDLPVAATMRIDIAPLATLTLSFHCQWRLQELRLPR